VRAIAVKLGWTPEDALAVRYELEGDLKRLCVPRASSPLGDELWLHTCFELFIGGPRPSRQRAYHELNFSPSGQSTACAFQGYRDRSTIAVPQIEPQVDVCEREGGLTLNAVIHLDHLGIAREGRSLSLGAAAVIEARDGTLTYWALRHAPGRPDFHHPDAFAFRLR
jgi:hypothetical protein